MYLCESANGRPQRHFGYQKTFDFCGGGGFGGWRLVVAKIVLFLNLKFGAPQKSFEHAHNTFKKRQERQQMCEIARNGRASAESAENGQKLSKTAENRSNPTKNWFKTAAKGIRLLGYKYMRVQLKGSTLTYGDIYPRRLLNILHF